jgi:ubiquinone biosynthesis protein
MQRAESESGAESGSVLGDSVRAAAAGDERGARESFLGLLDRFLRGLARAAWQLRGAADGVVAELWRWREVAEQKRRLAGLGWMLTQIIADYRAHAIYSAFQTEAGGARSLAKIHARSAQRFLAASLAHGGAFLKLGQMLSARPDLLPSVWVETLAALQDRVPPVPFAAVRTVIEAELGGTLEDHFAVFDETPLAAASIGQVHRAVTRDGLEVAVKIQRPGIAALVEMDLALLEVALDALASIMPPLDRTTVTTEIRAQLRRELDYRAEADAMGRVRDIVAAIPGVLVPTPHRALSTARVLVSTFVRGDKITTALDGRDAGARAAILGTLLEAYLAQMLVAGFFQADPHPGNFLVTERDELVLLDFGCAREIAPDARRAYVALVQRLLAGHSDGLGDLFARLGLGTRSGGTDTLERFAAAYLAELRSGALRGELVWPSRAELLARTVELVAAVERDPITKIPGELVMMSRVLATLGGLFQHHRPVLDFAARVLPHLVRAAQEP